MFHRSPSRVFHPLAAILIVCAGLANAQSPRPELIHTRVYPVADLVTPIPGKPAAEKDTPPHVGLMRIMQTTIQPASWSDAGGQGTIDFHDIGNTLVVAQTESVHKKVAELLSSMRKAQDVQVATEIRVLHFTDASFAEFAKQAGLDKRNTATVDDAASAKLMQVIQANIESTVMCAPKLTTFNGQEGMIRADVDQQFTCDMTLTDFNGQTVILPKNRDFKTGCQFTLRPTLTPDHKHVVMSFNAEVADLGDTKTPVFPLTTMITPVFEGGAIGQPIPFTQLLQQPQIVKRGIQQSICLPDGQTAVIYAGRSTRTVTSEAKVPVLGALPIIGGLFETEATIQCCDHLVFMVRPQIIVACQGRQKVLVKEIVPCCPLTKATCTATAAMPAPCCVMDGLPACMPCPPTAPAPMAQGAVTFIARVMPSPCCVEGKPCTPCPAAPVATAACTHTSPVCQPAPIDALCCPVTCPGACANCPKMCAPIAAPAACAQPCPACPSMPVAKCAMPIPMGECKDAPAKEKCITLKATIITVNPEYFGRPEAAAWSDLSPKECDGKVKFVEAAVAERFCRALRAQNFCKVLAQPILVTTNGKAAYFQSSGEQTTGFTLDLGFGNGHFYADHRPQTRKFVTGLTMTPTLSADGRYCRLALCAETSRLADEQVVRVSSEQEPGQPQHSPVLTNVQKMEALTTARWGQSIMFYMPGQSGEGKQPVLVIVTPEKVD